MCRTFLVIHAQDMPLWASPISFPIRVTDKPFKRALPQSHLHCSPASDHFSPGPRSQQMLWYSPTVPHNFLLLRLRSGPHAPFAWSPCLPSAILPPVNIVSPPSSQMLLVQGDLSERFCPQSGMLQYQTWARPHLTLLRSTLYDSSKISFQGKLPFLW